MKTKQVKQLKKKRHAATKKLFSKNSSTFFPAVNAYVDPVKKAIEPAVNSAGFSMPAETKKFFEPRFGYSFDDIKIHSGTNAVRSAEELNANAYTYKDHIVF